MAHVPIRHLDNVGVHGCRTKVSMTAQCPGMDQRGRAQEFKVTGTSTSWGRGLLGWGLELDLEEVGGEMGLGQQRGGMGRCTWVQRGSNPFEAAFHSCREMSEEDCLERTDFYSGSFFWRLKIQAAVCQALVKSLLGCLTSWVVHTGLPPSL